MRIIAGSIRGLKLNSPEGDETRPTLDRVKEAVFSMLMPYLNEACVLDMFSGSGALGIEALSRGARHAVFAEKRHDAFNCIKKNIEAAKVGDRTDAFLGDAFDYLESSKLKFDIVFIDPPYESNLYYKATESVSKLLSEKGIVVIEWDYSLGKPPISDKLCIVKEKKYGRVGITLLKRG